MTQRVTFPTESGEASGVLVTPAQEGRRPAVVVIHEWWGVNDQIQSIAASWAKEGFVAIVPDLYHGKIASTTEDAAAMMQKLDFPTALQEIAGAVAFLKDHPRSNGKVAVTGYCMGGALSFATACTVSGLSAVVPFYGLPPGGDWSRVDAPVMAHFAVEDDWATVDGAKAIQVQMAQHKRQMELHVYAAKHAFCNDKRPEVYNPEACVLAWSRTVEFVRRLSL